MNTPLSHIAADHDHPILFRTMGQSVFESTINTGSVWLRSDQYYRDIEDRVRKDTSEGVCSGKHTIPLNLKMNEAGGSLIIGGTGTIAQTLVPHYIVSLHGSSISDSQHVSFGGFTVGVKSIQRLCAALSDKAMEQIGAHQWTFGQVAYQHTAFTVTANPVGSAPINFGDSALSLTPFNPHGFRKDPVWPFIEQDEWRIILLPERYLNDDPTEPLRLTVDPGHFYPYLKPQ